MHTSYDIQESSLRPAEGISRSLRISIIGAGVAGLSTALALRKAGFQLIEIYEGASMLREVGAGIQCAPNMARIISSLGLLEDLRPYAVTLSAISLRRWQDDTVLGRPSTMPLAEQAYGFPSWVVHRADLQSVLLSAVQRHKIPVYKGKRVKDVEFAKSTVVFEGGHRVKSDVILAADGIKSTVRSKILALCGVKDETLPTGDSAYRATIPRADLERHPDLMNLVNANLGVRWMGPGRHLMAYPIRAGQLYNIVVCHPDRGGTTESWITKGSKPEMLEQFRGWCEPVRKLLDLVNEDTLMESRLLGHAPLPTWVKDTTALLGDACHPMLPYVAQGAAQAMEDGIVLSVVLSAIRDRSQVNEALALYESLRKDRAEIIQSSASDTRSALHMPDGPGQEARDRRLNAKAGEDMTNPDKWSDPSWQQYAWGTDVMQDALNTLQPLSLGNLHRRAIFTKPRPVFPFMQGLPRTHGANIELRHYHGLSLGAPATRGSARRTIRTIAPPIRSWVVHPLSKRAPIFTTAGVLASLCACLSIKSC